MSTQEIQKKDSMTNILNKLGGGNEIKGFGILSIIGLIIPFGVLWMPYLIVAMKKENISSELKKACVDMFHFALNGMIAVILLSIVMGIIISIIPALALLNFVVMIAYFGLFVWRLLPYIQGKEWKNPAWIEKCMIVKLELAIFKDTKAK